MEMRGVLVEINGPYHDVVCIETSYPDPLMPTAPAYFNIEAPKGTGLKYALEHFPDAVITVYDRETGDVTHYN